MRGRRLERLRDQAHIAFQLLEASRAGEAAFQMNQFVCGALAHVTLQQCLFG